MKSAPLRIVCLGLAAGWGVSCTAPRPPLVVTDRDPSVKIPAIQKAVREHDTSAIPQLIKDLDNDDPAVRLYAIHALHALTGERFDFSPYADEDRRQPALRRWQQWLQDHPQSLAGNGSPAGASRQK